MIKIIIHPPTDNKLRAYCKSDNYTQPKSYLERNKDIVNSCEQLIACPLTQEEELRSGTWATIRYARKTNKHILLFI
jgi:predicted Rossmann fold nucleotide-binding protein DprA/Smf involved in DNA uptake